MKFFIFNRFRNAVIVASSVLALMGCSSGSSSPATASISGTAATGAAMIGTIYVKDSTGSEVNIAIGSNGQYTVDVTGKAAPFIIKAVPSDVAKPTQYSYAAAANTTVNVTPLTTLALFLANGKQDISLLAANWATQAAQITQQALATAQAKINANFSSMFPSGLDPNSYNFLSTAFTADGGGFDSLLDKLSVTIDMANGSFSINANNSPFTFNTDIDISGSTLPGLSGGGSGTLPSSVSGQVVTMQYGSAGAGSPYNNGDQVLFTFSSSGSLMLTNQYTVVADSFTVDSYSQYIWTAASGIKYVLSLSAGAIHEVNVMSAGNSFLGQFAPVSSGTGGGGAGGSTSLGVVANGFAVGSTNAERLQNVSGTWDVVIYRTPSSQVDLIGPAKLVVGETSGVKAIKLTKLDGTVISKAGTDFAYLDPATSFQIYAQGAAYIVGVNGTALNNYMTAKFETNGEIYGTAGGFGEIGFRNNITAYGSSIPAVFTALAGTWTGPAGDLTCQPNPLSVTIGSDGSVSYTGKWSLSCGQASVSNIWDGNDDYIIPTAGGYTLAIDSVKGGGSASEGGIIIKLSAIDNPTSITEITTAASGATGDMNLYNPAKQ